SRPYLADADPSCDHRSADLGRRARGSTAPVGAASLRIAAGARLPAAAAAATRPLGSLHPPGRAGQRTWTKTVNVMWSEAFLLENATTPRWPSDDATLLSNDDCAAAGSTVRIAVSTDGTST